jgi:subtilase family serine protease
VGQYICETIGEIDLYAIVDWGEEISEMDENNNKASKTIVVE